MMDQDYSKYMKHIYKTIRITRMTAFVAYRRFKSFSKRASSHPYIAILNEVLIIQNYVPGAVKVFQSFGSGLLQFLQII